MLTAMDFVTILDRKAKEYGFYQVEPENDVISMTTGIEIRRTYHKGIWDFVLSAERGNIDDAWSVRMMLIPPSIETDLKYRINEHNTVTASVDLVKILNSFMNAKDTDRCLA